MKYKFLKFSTNRSLNSHLKQSMATTDKLIMHHDTSRVGKTFIFKVDDEEELFVASKLACLSSIAPGSTPYIVAIGGNCYWLNRIRPTHKSFLIAQALEEEPDFASVKETYMELFPAIWNNIMKEFNDLKELRASEPGKASWRK